MLAEHSGHDHDLRTAIAAALIKGCAPGCDYPISGYHARHGGYLARHLPARD